MERIGVLFLLALTACNPGDLLGNGGNSGGGYTPDMSKAPPAHSASLPCGDSDPTHLCVAVKYAVFQDSSGVPIVSPSQAAQNVDGVNSIWTQCHVQFYLEKFAEVDPGSYSIPFQPGSPDDLQSVRQALDESDTLLVATTGQFTGDLAANPANAWTQMPPVGPFGSTLEQSVGAYPGIIAHELGHYLNLQHVSDQFDVMNPTIYANSLNLTSDQCAMARATAISFWGAALR